MLARIKDWYIRERDRKPTRRVLRVTVATHSVLGIFGTLMVVFLGLVGAGVRGS